MVPSSLFTQVIGFLSIVLGSGVFGAWLIHRRLAPKSTAEAISIRDAIVDNNWSRFQREIDRLVQRVENAEAAPSRP
jgi:hypothetical protein